MKITRFALAVVSLSSVALIAPQAEAKPGGCLKYGAAGAVAGHLSGHHGVKGALVGCATGIYIRHEYKKQQKEKANEPQPNNAPAPSGTH
ncbi:MAG: hypothetical protein ABSC72_00655 [Methylovirgula sp.]|jgi:hypothetical protein